MKILIVQHVSFEGPGSIAQWAKKKGHDTSYLNPDKEDPFPENIEKYDLLIILGGPMNVYDYAEYPWLADEKDFIKEFIIKGKKVLGICLGAQLIADVLGAEVYPSGKKEIGWFNVKKEMSGFTDIFPELPDEAIAFHWHGDTFELPEGAQRLYSSEATLNQAFTFGDRVIGLQFHWEITPENLENLLKHASGDLEEGPFVQTPEEMREKASFEEVNRLMDKVLDYLEEV